MNWISNCTLFALTATFLILKSYQCSTEIRSKSMDKDKVEVKYQGQCQSSHGRLKVETQNHDLESSWSQDYLLVFPLRSV